MSRRMSCKISSICRSVSVDSGLVTTYIYIYTHTHTHKRDRYIHMYISDNIYIYIYIYIQGDSILNLSVADDYVCIPSRIWI